MSAPTIQNPFCTPGSDPSVRVGRQGNQPHFPTVGFAEQPEKVPTTRPINFRRSFGPVNVTNEDPIVQQIADFGGHCR
jgi:hypothetical protein